MISQEKSVIPAPKQSASGEEEVCLDHLILYLNDSGLQDLHALLNEEFFVLTGKQVDLTGDPEAATIVAEIDPVLKEEAYRIEFATPITIKGGSYDALAMASVTLLQRLKEPSSTCWSKGQITDYPAFEFRSVLIDLARRKHDLATIRRVIMLCRWYKINYLQLHLSDEHAFTFPSRAFPQLPTEGWVYTREELQDLIAFAEQRGVELIPELEVPGHAGQFVKKMPEVFGFKDPSVHPYTIHMGRAGVYEVLDTLIAEIAEVFHASEYIHIGGDEANFKGMENDPEIQAFLDSHDLKNMEALYWYFLNRMNAMVKRHGKKTIVWEGFSKEGNAVIDKDIVVMAWESKYQLPQDILEAGFKTINVSWKPLYVVNERKWSPEEIYAWNIFRWENWVPSIPSYTPIQLEAHPGMLGASMASWDQPAYTELSSLRQRIPAFMEEVWNHGKKSPLEVFEHKLSKTDERLDRYLSPVTIRVAGLSFPDVKDGHQDEQTWFDDSVRVSLSTRPDLVIRFSTDGTPVTPESPVYREPLEFSETTELRYSAFRKDQPVGAAMLEYFELHPLRVALTGSFAMPPEERWDTPELHLITFQDSIRIEISAARKGEIKYSTGDQELSDDSPAYTNPIIIQDDSLVKAGLFLNGEQVGASWQQHFKKVRN